MVYLGLSHLCRKKKMVTLAPLSILRGVIHNKEQRDLWYKTKLQVVSKRGTPGSYAYGSSDHKVVKSINGWKLKGEELPQETPIYEYGFSTYGKRMSVPHGFWIFQHQIPGFDLTDRSTVEEKLFSSKDRVFHGSETIDRSRKKKLRVRCGKNMYRIVLLNVKVKTNTCYIFGTNIRVDTRKYNIPNWMRRPTVVLPNPARTSKDEVSNKFGFTMEVGRPSKPGPVKVGGIEMFCTGVGQLCKIEFCSKIFYAHHSVVFPYKRSTE